jgi:hypothetical protein
MTQINDARNQETECDFTLLLILFTLQRLRELRKRIFASDAVCLQWKSRRQERSYRLDRERK